LIGKLKKVRTKAGGLGGIMNMMGGGKKKGNSIYICIYMYICIRFRWYDEYDGGGQNKGDFEYIYTHIYQYIYTYIHVYLYMYISIYIKK
jgi:hypothetical protein